VVMLNISEGPSSAISWSIPRVISLEELGLMMRSFFWWGMMKSLEVAIRATVKTVFRFLSLDSNPQSINRRG